jgi:uncharacterized protein involved in exopolysaccharide biosynthesis
MADLYKASNKVLKSTKSWGFWLFYLSLALAGNACLWSLALAYLKVTPKVYASEWTLSLPGTTTRTKISLPNSGNAESEGVSPYANTTQDPRENYKFIAASDVVQKSAATQLQMTPKDFGKPRIKIVDNTTLISFQITGKSPGEAQKKSFAFYKSFQARLNELRAEETIQREAKFQGKVRNVQEKLKNSQKRLADYQVRSGFASNTQIEQLTENIALLRKLRAETIVQQQQSSTRLNQLSTNLDLTASQATDFVILKADQLFQQYLKDYTDITAKLVLLNSKYLSNHPSIVQEQSKLDSVKVALQNRGSALLGRPMNPATIEQLNIDQGVSTSTRENFVKELVTSQVDQKGYTASVQEIDRQIAQFEEKLKSLTQSASDVEALKRDMRIDEAIFSSTLSSVDIRNLDVFGSYPEVQLLGDPSYSDEPISPKTKLVLLGTALGSLFSITALLLLWLRQHKKIGIRKILERRIP